MDEKKSSVRFALQLLNSLMKGEKLTVSTISQKSSFKEAAVRRSLEQLKQIIPEVQSEGSRPQIWSFKWPDQYISDTFTILTLRLARALLSFLRGSELDAKLSEILMEHLQRANIPATGPADISRMFFAKTKMVKPLDIRVNTIDILVQSIFEQNCVQAVYQQFDGKVNNIKIQPYSLIFSDEGLYCYAKCVNSENTNQIDTCRLYHIGRFQIIKPIREHFLYPERDEYDPETVFRHCFGTFLPSKLEDKPDTIVCKFAPRWKSYLYNHRWHESQTDPIELDNGYTQVSFYLYITPDLIRWLRGFGSEIEIILPEKLKTYF